MDMDLTETWEAMVSYLLAIGLGEGGDADIQVNVSGQVIRLRVRNSRGEIKLSVVGETPSELGQQLALACLKNLTIEDLKLLQMEPLKGAIQVLRHKE